MYLLKLRPDYGHAYLHWALEFPRRKFGESPNVLDQRTLNGHS